MNNKNIIQEVKKEIKESYKKFLFDIFIKIGKKLFTVVSEISPNNQDTFIIFSNDQKLNELVQKVATPSKPIEFVTENVSAKRRGRPPKTEKNERTVRTKRPRKKN